MVITRPTIKPETVKSQKHYHCYKRMRERKAYYRCILPDCSHYLHKMYLKGKRALCPHCASLYIIEGRILEHAMLHCESCTGVKKGSSLAKKAKSTLDRLSENINKFFDVVDS